MVGGSKIKGRRNKIERETDVDELCMSECTIDTAHLFPIYVPLEARSVNFIQKKNLCLYHQPLVLLSLIFGTRLIKPLLQRRNHSPKPVKIQQAQRRIAEDIGRREPQWDGQATRRFFERAYFIAMAEALPWDSSIRSLWPRRNQDSSSISYGSSPGCIPGPGPELRSSPIRVIILYQYGAASHKQES